MDMEFGACCKHVSFCTELFPSSDCDYLNFNCINCIIFFICKVYYDLIKTVIWSSIQKYRFIFWFVSDVSHIDCPELKEFCFWALLALEKIFLPLRVFCQVQNSIKAGFVDSLVHFRLSCLNDSFLWLSIIFMPKFISKLRHELFESPGGIIDLGAELEAVRQSDQ